MNIEESIQFVVEKAFQKQFNSFRERLLQDLEPHKLLTINEASEILRITPRTLLNRIHNNKIKASYNGRWLIRMSEINKYQELNK